MGAYAAAVAEARKGPAVIAGHFGLAAGVKSQERRVPLWALMLATAWLDVVFIPLYLLGIDHLQLTYHYQGRDFRLTDTAGKVVQGVLA